MKTVAEARDVFAKVQSSFGTKIQATIKADKVKDEKHLVFKDGTRRSFRIEFKDEYPSVTNHIALLIEEYYRSGFSVEYRMNPVKNSNVILAVMQPDPNVGLNKDGALIIGEALNSMSLQMFDLSYLISLVKKLVALQYVSSTFGYMSAKKSLIDEAAGRVIAVAKQKGW